MLTLITPCRTLRNGAINSLHCYIDVPVESSLAQVISIKTYLCPVLRSVVLIYGKSRSKRENHCSSDNIASKRQSNIGRFENVIVSKRFVFEVMYTH
jgi:hypothetical protein